MAERADYQGNGLALVDDKGRVAIPNALRAALATNSPRADGKDGGTIIIAAFAPPLTELAFKFGPAEYFSLMVLGLIGAVVLFAAHLHSGVLNRQTLIFSALLVIPAQLGQMIGTRIQDRLDQSRFRRWTLILLVLTGLNLARRAVGL